MYSHALLKVHIIVGQRSVRTAPPPPPASSSQQSSNQRLPAKLLRHLSASHQCNQMIPIVDAQQCFWLFFQKVTAVVIIIDLKHNIMRNLPGRYEGVVVCKQ